MFTAEVKHEILGEVRTHYEHVTFAIRFWKLWLGGVAECSKAFLEHFNVCIFTAEVKHDILREVRTHYRQEVRTVTFAILFWNYD